MERYTCGALHLWSVRLWSGASTGVCVFFYFSKVGTCIFVNEITKFWSNLKYEEDLRDLRLWSSAPIGVHVFWLISPIWLTFQAKDMHIRE